jgi:hypothetical protein
MNPELQRNLWLEASPGRLALTAGLLLLVFAAVSVALPGLANPSAAALALYWFFAVLWGTRSAALAVVGEIRERTWDGQKLSSIGPWQMVWGKLFGATAANWFGALLCLPVILAPAWRGQGAVSAITYGAILLALGVFAQAVALLSSLMLIRRNTGNWRLDTFLCQVAGIGAAFAYYTLWSSVAAFARSGEQTLVWWGHEFNVSSFHLTSLLLFLGWALVGCWRAMRAELRFANGPFVWLAYLAYLCVYDAGFESWIAARIPSLELTGANPALHDAALRLALAGLALMVSAYGMVFLEPKDPVRLRWLGEQLRAGHLRKAFLALDAWMLSYGATLIVGLLLAMMLALDDTTVGMMRLSSLSLPVLALLGFVTRDMAIFVLMRSVAGAKGDFAALALLGALYLLLPLIVQGLGLSSFRFLFVPVLDNRAAFGVLAAWAQGTFAVALALRGISAKLNAL